MKRYDVNLFSTPLMIIKLDDNQCKEIENIYIEKVYSHKEKTESRKKEVSNIDPNKFNYTSDTSGYTSYYVESLLKNEDFFPLKKYLDSAIKLSLSEKEETTNFDLEWMDFWYTIYGKGHIVQEHFHPNSIISGVFYLKCPPKCGDIVFCDNNYNFKNYCVNTTCLKTFTYPKEYPVTPESGMILLFPSWLSHKTTPNQSDGEKIMFAFNMIPINKSFKDADIGVNSYFKHL